MDERKLVFVPKRDANVPVPHVLGSVMYVDHRYTQRLCAQLSYADDVPLDTASWLLRSTSTAQLLPCIDDVVFQPNEAKRRQPTVIFTSYILCVLQSYLNINLVLGLHWAYVSIY